MSEHSACMGCLVNPNWYKDFTTNSTTYHQPSEGLTFSEKEILKNLAEAWNQYVVLETKDSSLQEFNDAIHRCQQLIALRVARRIDPTVWVQG